MNTTNNPIEALNQANISDEFLKEVKKYISSPLCSLILPKAGITKQEALSYIDSLEKMRAENSPSTFNESKNSSSTNNQGDDLSKFRKGLNFLNH
jgi:hypothetical protein